MVGQRFRFVLTGGALCLALVGCGNTGNNTGGFAWNAGGSGGGFAGNAALGTNQHRAGSIQRGGQDQGAALAVRPDPFVMSEHAQIRSADKTVVLTIADLPQGARKTTGTAAATSNGTAAAGQVNIQGAHGHPLSIHVPKGWRVLVVMRNNTSAHEPIMVPYSQRFINGSYPASPVTRPANATVIFKARTPGSYALLCSAAGHQNGLLARVYVATGPIAPSVARV